MYVQQFPPDNHLPPTTCTGTNERHETNKKCRGGWETKLLSIIKSLWTRTCLLLRPTRRPSAVVGAGGTSLSVVRACIVLQNFSFILTSFPQHGGPPNDVVCSCPKPKIIYGRNRKYIQGRQHRMMIQQSVGLTLLKKLSSAHQDVPLLLFVYLLNQKPRRRRTNFQISF